MQLEDFEPTDEEESEWEPEPEMCRMDDGEIRIKIRKRKPKYKSPRYIIIFDDLSLELKHPKVSHLLNTNRHYLSKMIVSSQYLNDVAKMGRKQIDNYILFGGFNVEKLEEMYINSDIGISFELFLKLYKDATSERFHFFYVDTLGDYRKDFNIRYDV
jgi:hypothetical protein